MKGSVLVLVLLFLDITKSDRVAKFSLLMPNVKPTTPESYLCTPFKVDTANTYYIVGFEPNATMDTAHHIIIYGCSKPGTDKVQWDCGEMSALSFNSIENKGACQGESEVSNNLISSI
ncbi:peptidylglycine alpha-hydroxylating monooxygenase-like [Copidosoma floridanum]|uniref:peptidylglycine alpha-hydroxylating monooxygenase-like n=1 Tax=Copidosoma floridanum TaxID=29053 RepID=UPI0006C9A609|nr:peptidylglycine alpha-hydroxylating monooxygenase-like [Copidosoma floridanum]